MPEDYLRPQHLEPMEVTQLSAREAPLFNRMTEASFSNEGLIEFGDNGVKFSISYGPSSGIEKYGGFNKENYRSLKRFQIEVEGKSVFDSSEHDLHLLFSEKFTGDGGGFVDRKGRTIVLNADILSPLGIIGFLHEVGHLEDPFQSVSSENFERSRSVYSRANSGMPLNFKDSELILRSERNAWAYALKVVKPVFGRLKEFDKKVITDYAVHRRSLSGYSDKIRQSLGIWG